MRYLEVVKFVASEYRMVVARGYGKEEMESFCLIDTEFVSQDEKFLEICFTIM